MEVFLRQERARAAVDATHPYAAQAGENISRACDRIGVMCLRLQRGASAGDADGLFFPDAGACARRLRESEGRILLTTGTRTLPVFCEEESLRRRLYVRVLPDRAALRICEDCDIAPERIIAMQGPFDEEMNVATLRMTGAGILVTKDSGAAGGYEAKIRAARRVGAQVMIIGRPPRAQGLGIGETEAILASAFSLAPPRRQVILAGVGPGDRGSRTLDLEQAIQTADCVIGAQRLLALFDLEDRRAIAMTRPDDIVERIRADGEARRFVVLLSGDPGFFSAAKQIRPRLEGFAVRALPGVSSLSALCARIGRGWDDVRVLSLHGRDGAIERAVARNPAVFALTGGQYDVSAILGRLVRAGLGDVRATVGERLGDARERIVTDSARRLAGERFDPLSVLLLENSRAWDAPAVPGLPDELFERGQVPMTKSEVRCVALSRLQPGRRSVIYDVGAGTGSISVEAALIAGEGVVYAVERRPEAVRLIRRNAEAFCAANVTVVEGEAPGALEPLPPPTHAFIGGSGGRMREIVDCLRKKNPRVRIVATAVTLETLGELTRIGEGFSHFQVLEMSVSRAKSAGGRHLMTAANPVYIFTFWDGEDKTAGGETDHA